MWRSPRLAKQSRDTAAFGLGVRDYSRADVPDLWRNVAGLTKNLYPSWEGFGSDVARSGARVGGVVPWITLIATSLNEGAI